MAHMTFKGERSQANDSDHNPQRPKPKERHTLLHITTEPDSSKICMYVRRHHTKFKSKHCQQGNEE